MDIQRYFERLNSESQKVFDKSKLQRHKLGVLHNLSSCVHEFSVHIVDIKEREFLETVCVQFESATFYLTLGLYRQAFSSLRLALEMGLAAVFFSVNKMELYEWLNGGADIKWSRLTDKDNGVLSKRFANVFFAALSDRVNEYREIAIDTYRKLSEYVHGNIETWDGGIKLSYNEHAFDRYFDFYKTVVDVVLFALICRYASTFDDVARESLQFVPEEFSHISEIRLMFGRS